MAVRLAEGDSTASAELDSLAAELRQGMVDRGHLQASAVWETAATRRGIAVVFTARPGPRALVAGWDIDGIAAVDSARVRRAMPRRGTVLSRRAVEAAVGRVLLLHEENGYPFCRVEPAALAESCGWFRPRLRVESGARVELSSIDFAGRFVTRRELLTRSSGFKPGRVYSPAAVQAWRRGLERTGWVRCDSQHVVIRDSGFGLRMWVTEQRTNWVSAAAGYSPGEPLNGTAQIRLLNLLGTGRRLEAGWRAGAGRTSYELGYTEPWVLRSAVDMTAAAEHQVYDTTYAKTTFSLGATAPAGSFVVSLSGGWEQVAMNVAGRVQTAWVGTGVEYDSRDSRWNPGHGSRLAVATRAGQRVAADSARSSVVRAEVRTEVLAPLGVRFAWANSVNGRAVVPEAGLAEPELYHLGGANSVRGFDEDAYTTSRAAWVSTEFRYRLSADAYVYPFVDAAVFDQDGARNIMAYGVGGRWQTRVGRLGLDYGIAAGEALLHGKVHLSFEGGF